MKGHVRQEQASCPSRACVIALECVAVRVFRVFRVIRGPAAYATRKALAEDVNVGRLFGGQRPAPAGRLEIQLELIPASLGLRGALNEVLPDRAVCFRHHDREGVGNQGRRDLALQ